MMRANAATGNLSILLPMVTSIDEIDEARRLIERAGREVEEMIGYAIPKPRIGVMLEVPSMVFMLPQLASRVDFISVGTNDLTQYMLAVDRNNTRVASIYDSLHPAMLRALAMIAREAEQCGLDLRLCGEMAGDSMCVAILIGLGFRHLSMKLTPNFYRDRVCLNVLAGSRANASAIYEAAEGHVLVGVLSKNYPDVASAVADMREYAALIDNALSVGLGAGDPNQSAMVSEISRQVQPQHVNQVFTGVATSRALLGQNDSVVNGLVSPTGTVGMLGDGIALPHSLGLLAQKTVVYTVLAPQGIPWGDETAHVIFLLAISKSEYEEAMAIYDIFVTFLRERAMITPF